MKPQGSMLQDDDLAKGTPLWMAPEVMQFLEFNEKADVYSFGIVLWELLTREEPFSNHSNYSKFKRAVCERHERPPIPADCEPSLKNLIEKCWHPNPSVRPSFSQIIHDLENIMVDVACRDLWGRKLWKENFLAQEEVPWEDFSRALLKLLKIPSEADLTPADQDNLTLNLRCLKALLSEKPKAQAQVAGRADQPVVSLQNWGRMLVWFGPITDPDKTSFRETFLDGIRKTLSQQWFHGDIDNVQSQEKLSGKPGGTFMIRFSSVEGWFTISLITRKRLIQHQRIRHQPGEPYYVENEAYPSLEALVEGRGLTQPCEGSRFSYLFYKKDPAEYIAL